MIADTCMIIWVLAGMQSIDNCKPYPIYIVQDTDYQTYISYDPKFKDHPKSLFQYNYKPEDR
jgi:hypothetical protein